MLVDEKKNIRMSTNGYSMGKNGLSGQVKISCVVFTGGQSQRVKKQLKILLGIAAFTVVNELPTAAVVPSSCSVNHFPYLLFYFY
jgi:hypothetical protein